jgi:DNA-binding response OmpR family regulator
MKQPERILVVDDNETNRDILEARLTANGYEVLHAADGELALAMAAQHRPDLILLDIMMPKVDGIEVCRRIKADAELAFTPIILVTAKSDSKDVVDGLDAGADEYLTKPIDQTALVARVKALLRRRALHAAKPERAAPRKPDATDLFLSYSRQDMAKIETLAAVLQQAGWSVWWDRHIKTGTSFDKVIEQALTNSRAVIVAWSKNSVDSDWVRAEAAYALESNKLLPVRLDEAAPPLRFINMQTVNFSNWDGSRDDQAFRTLVADLSHIIEPPSKPQP